MFNDSKVDKAKMVTCRGGSYESVLYLPHKLRPQVRWSPFINQHLKIKDTQGYKTPPFPGHSQYHDLDLFLK